MPGAILVFRQEPSDLQEVMSDYRAFEKQCDNIWIWKSPLGDIKVSGYTSATNDFILRIHTNIKGIEGSLAENRTFRLAFSLRNRYKEQCIFKYID